MSACGTLNTEIRPQRARALEDFIEGGRSGGGSEPEQEREASSPKKETQIIAIYGKGGSGKSFALANLSYMMAQQGKRVLLIGCDPKSDTTSLLFGGRATPTIIETPRRRSSPAKR